MLAPTPELHYTCVYIKEYIQSLRDQRRYFLGFGALANGSEFDIVLVDNSFLVE